jgi:hypothetical protein
MEVFIVGQRSGVATTDLREENKDGRKRCSEGLIFTQCSLMKEYRNGCQTLFPAQAWLPAACLEYQASTSMHFLN